MTELARHPTEPSLNTMILSVRMFAGSSSKPPYRGRFHWYGPGRARFGPLFANTDDGLGSEAAPVNRLLYFLIFISSRFFQGLF